MKRLVALAACALCLSAEGSSVALLGHVDPGEVAAAITRLDVERARELLASARTDTPALALQRARLSIYVGDCDAAGATLASLEPSEQVNELATLARTCARGTAGSVVVDDQKNGLWLRLQDDGDRALLPYIVDVAVRARAAVEARIGTNLPRPLRLDLVRDLFTLSAVSGLPLDAAETTGTVAVARWGRVTMLSPRAAPHGYAWEDTLAHELTHLALSRATRDFAPLWLQEGLAKITEKRWRDERPFDDHPEPSEIARQALDDGESVGVDALGPSIAMLPSARAASIAFAEVESFVDFLLDSAGTPALQLLLLDLEGLESREADEALLSVTGYDLSGWIARWQAHLLKLDAPQEMPEVVSVSVTQLRTASRSVRLGDLLTAAGEVGVASDVYQSSLEAGGRDPALLWRAGRSLLATERPTEAAKVLGTLSDLNVGHAGWYAITGRLLENRGEIEPARERYGLALALDPYMEDSACEGLVPTASGQMSKRLPKDPARRALCEAARKIPRE
jgi:Flp pilus assembly protein TadD